MEKIVDYHKVNPILAKSFYLSARILFPMKEYNKDNLTESSYIFAPSHATSWDGYLSWSLLNPKYDSDMFIYKECWEDHPHLSKLAPYFNIYPLTRTKMVPNELKDELNRLKNEDHSLIIFPQGRHVDAKVMSNLFDEHLKTIPMGAFYIAAKSGKKILPMFLEPQRMFGKNAVVYGNAIDPKDYDAVTERGIVKKDNLIYLAEAWLKEIVACYENGSNLAEREMRKYPKHSVYRDATGNEPIAKDPNEIINYLEEIDRLKKAYIDIGTENLDILGKVAEVEEDRLEDIKEIKDIYEKCLVRK